MSEHVEIVFNKEQNNSLLFSRNPVTNDLIFLLRNDEKHEQFMGINVNVASARILMKLLQDFLNEVALEEEGPKCLLPNCPNFGKHCDSWNEQHGDEK
jgi:hypothetical protein